MLLVQDHFCFDKAKCPITYYVKVGNTYFVTCNDLIIKRSANN